MGVLLFVLLIKFFGGGMSGLSRFVKGGEWGLEIFATWVALSILCVYWSAGFLVSALKAFLGRKTKRVVRKIKPRTSYGNVVDTLVTEPDVHKLIGQLDELGVSGSGWNFVLEKSNKDVSYSAKRRDPRDGGPTEYLSTTTFQNCTVELLRDFYMDNEFRLQWDKTVVRHDQLAVCRQSGTEIGRTVKKFPLMTAREYVLAWRLWEGSENTFYCVIKACEHPAAPRLQQFKRVVDYLSGWRIRAVPGSNACEVKMFHREDLGTSREMAKMAFSRGIWSYVTKMEQNLKTYTSVKKRQSTAPDAVSLCCKLKPEFERKQTPVSVVAPAAAAPAATACSSSSSSTRRSNGSDRNRNVSLLTQSMFLLGWAVFLGHGSTSFGAKVAAAVFMNKAVRRRRTDQVPRDHRYVSKSFSIHRSS